MPAMSTRTLGLSDSLHRYFLSTLVQEPELLARLRKETQSLKGAGMQISPEQGRFMRWLTRLIGARRCIEVGVFTGYSSLSVALSLPDDGRIVACDVSEEMRVDCRAIIVRSIDEVLWRLAVDALANPHAAASGQQAVKIARCAA